MKERFVATINRGNMEVRLVKLQEVPSFGYRFDAVGNESLPLAVELACLQTKEGVAFIDQMVNIRGS